MHSPELIEQFRAFAAASPSAVEGAFLVGRAIAPDFDAGWCRAEFARLAAGSSRTAPALVASLRAAGFAGAEDYYSASNSSLEQVLRSRRGIPISLAMVVLGVAEELGVPATGINFPRHFLVELDRLLVDPFGMQLTDRATCVAWLEANDLAEEAAFQPATPVDVVLRMLNNLRLLALGGGDHARVLELSDYQLAVTPLPFPIHLERVDSWLALGATSMARHELEQALATAPTTAIRLQLETRLRTLAATPSALH